MNKLILTDEQLEAVQSALNLYMRIGIGQFSVIKDHPTIQKISVPSGDYDYQEFHEMREKFDDKLTEARNIIFKDLNSPKDSWSIYHKKAHKTCRIAFDIWQVIRKRFSSTYSPEWVATVAFSHEEDKTSELIKCIKE